MDTNFRSSCPFKDSVTPKVKPTFKVRIDHSRNPPTAADIREINQRTRLMERMLLHVIYLLTNDKEDARTKEREKCW